MKNFAQKLVSAKLFRGVDWTKTGGFPAGVTIVGAAVSVAVHPLSEVIDPNPSALIFGTPVFDDYRIAVVLIGGVPGCRYVITFTPTLSDGQIDPEQVSVMVTDLQN